MTFTLQQLKYTFQVNEQNNGALFKVIVIENVKLYHGLVDWLATLVPVLSTTDCLFT